MPSIRQSIRSSTASKRPTSAIADGQIALNTASGTPGIFFKDSAGNIVKAGPAHYGATAPNSSPAVGGSTGNSFGEAWLDVSLTPAGWKVWNGAAWVNATPLSSDTVQGLVELATNAETQAGVDAARAVTAASLQSKVSDSISTTSASGIASSTAVKTAYDLANAALPKAGGIITGNLEIGSTGSFTFEGSTADGFETALAVVDPTADRTITFPNITGTVITTGDTGTVTSTMLLDGTIVDADISASAEIAVSKLADGNARQLLQTDAAGTGVEWTSNVAVPGVLTVASGVSFASSFTVSGATTLAGGLATVTAVPSGSASAPSIYFAGDANTGIYSPGADQLAISTNGTSRIVVDASGNVNIDSNTLYVDAANNRVGIGTTGPSYLMHVYGSSPVLAVTQNPGIPGDAGIFLSAAGGGEDAFINFRSESQIWSNTSSTSLFIGNGDRTSIYATVTSTGRLGIGTTGPGGTLDIKAAASTAPLIVQGPSSEFARIDSSGNVGIGVVPSAWASGGSTLQIRSGHYYGDTSQSISTYNAFFNGAWTYQGTAAASRYSQTGGQHQWYNAPSGTAGTAITFTQAMTLDASGRLGVGMTPAAGTVVDILSTSNTSLTSALRVNSNNLAVSTSLAYDGLAGTGQVIVQAGASSALILGSNAAEKARIDSSGRLLVGTSTARSNFFNSTVSPLIQQEGVSGSSRFASITYGTNAEDDPIFILGKHRGASVGGTTVVNSGDGLGKISFQGSDGTEFVEGAAIRAEVDGTPGANDMPGRLVFSTTADGASSPTERMRITSGGAIWIGQTSTDTPGLSNTTNGAAIRGTVGDGFFSAGSTTSLYVNRNTNDGTLVSLRQDGVEEGTISVSGTTVSYNGAHLSRWSQLPSAQERTEILRGSILSNIDEMCEWGDEDNEQLNRMKVSDLEGDKNVSGVFQAWDDDDDIYTNDFYCAMTGDFIIRIAEGITVQRGDLLMSAGDGTAKPQDDDIIRSKTVAKVTSTNVSCTYEDGSYCVPCVLMAC